MAKGHARPRHVLLAGLNAMFACPSPACLPQKRCDKKTLKFVRPAVDIISGYVIVLPDERDTVTPDR